MKTKTKEMKVPLMRTHRGESPSVIVIEDAPEVLPREMRQRPQAQVVRFKLQELAPGQRMYVPAAILSKQITVRFAHMYLGKGNYATRREENGVWVYLLTAKQKELINEERQRAGNYPYNFRQKQQYTKTEGEPVKPRTRPVLPPPDTNRVYYDEFGTEIIEVADDTNSESGEGGESEDMATIEIEKEIRDSDTEWDDSPLPESLSTDFGDSDEE